MDAGSAALTRLPRCSRQSAIAGAAERSAGARRAAAGHACRPRFGDFWTRWALSGPAPSHGRPPAPCAGSGDHGGLLAAPRSSRCAWSSNAATTPTKGTRPQGHTNPARQGLRQGLQRPATGRHGACRAQCTGRASRGSPPRSADDSAVASGGCPQVSPNGRTEAFV